MSQSVKVKGLRELIAAADAADRATKREVRKRLRGVGEIVKADARSRFSAYDVPSAESFGVSVRKAGTVSVEQRKRRTTGAHPEFGVLNMTKALLPAAHDNEAEIVAEFEKAVDDAARIFTR